MFAALTEISAEEELNMMVIKSPTPTSISVRESSGFVKGKLQLILKHVAL